MKRNIWDYSGKRAVFALIVLMLCLIGGTTLADGASYSIPSALITAQSLDQVPEENADFSVWIKSSYELQACFRNSDPLYYTYCVSNTAYMHLFYSGTEGAYVGANYLMTSGSNPSPLYTYQVTVRYDDEKKGPCWYFVDLSYSLQDQSGYVSVTYHTSDMDGTLDYISVSDRDNRHFYYHPSGVWYQGKQSFIGEWYENVSGSYVAADVSGLSIPEFEPVSFSYLAPLRVCEGTLFPRLYFDRTSDILTDQLVTVNVWAYGSELIELVYDQGEGTEEVSETMPYWDEGHGRAHCEIHTPTTSQDRRYWARAHYTDGTIVDSKPLEISITAPNESFSDPVVNAQYSSNGNGGNTVTVGLQNEDDVDRYVVDLCAADSGEVVATAQTRGRIGSESTVTFREIATGSYEIRIVMTGRGYEETVFTRPLHIRKVYSETLTLPAGTEEIGSEAFSGTNIKFVCVPASARTVRAGAFAQCEALEVVQIEADELTVEAGAIPAGVVIRCHEGSAVEAWAQENSYTTEPLDN